MIWGIIFSVTSTSLIKARMLKFVESAGDHGQQELIALKNLSRHELWHFLNPDSPNSSHLSGTSFALPVPYQPAAPAEPHRRGGADRNTCCCSNGSPAKKGLSPSLPVRKAPYTALIQC